MKKPRIRTNKEKGDLLEEVVAQLCSGIGETKVTQKARVSGKDSLDKREVDVLIEGKHGVFDVKIAIEAKNYKNPVGVEKIESLVTKLKDIKADLGVMVCPSGFTEPAKNLAAANRIQLFEVYDPKLNNTKLFIPIKFIEPDIKNYRFRFEGFTPSFSLTTDATRWRFYKGGEILTASDLIKYALNHGMVPQKSGQHWAKFEAMKISDSQEPNLIQYSEISAEINIVEKYYLKLFPASFLKNISNGKKKFNIYTDVYSNEEDMLKNGWKKFETLEELNAAASMDDQLEEIRGLTLRPEFTWQMGQD